MHKKNQWKKILRKIYQRKKKIIMPKKIKKKIVHKTHSRKK